MARLTPDQFHTYVTVMRALGIQRFRDGDLEFDLGPVPKGVESGQHGVPVVDDPACACGCPMDEHMDGLCLNACAEAQCAEKKE